jgi:hypothetical protein
VKTTDLINRLKGFTITRMTENHKPLGFTFSQGKYAVLKNIQHNMHASK